MGSHRDIETKSSGFGTAGLVLGIIGVCTSFIPIINNISFVLAILAIVFGIVALAKKSGKGKVIASIILGIIAIAITVSSQKAMSDGLDAMSKELDKMSGASTEEMLKNDVNVEIGDFEAKEEDYMTETKLDVKIENKTTETKSFNIQIEAVDKDGKRIADDYVSVDKLSGGQSQDVEAFTFVSSDDAKKLEKATFKVVSVSMY